MYTDKDHTFAICAYKESPYLKECIESLNKQTVKSNIIIITSTPSKYIDDIATLYNIPVFVNDGEAGISGDWNFAYSKAATSLVTITHQDDIYEDEYVYNVLKYANSAYKPLILFSDYGELRNGNQVYSNKLLNIKKLMLLPLRIKLFTRWVFVRRRILSMGNPICCPSVTFVKSSLPSKLFTNEFQSDVDWQAWERLSKLKGSFVYIHKAIMLHRIHSESETTRIIGDNNRSKEDLEMFKKFWPDCIARFIEHFYSKGEDSNKL